MEKVSYVITLYNKEKFLRPVLNSVINQVEIDQKEIIIVNDGSTDDTVKIIENEYAHIEYIKLISISNSGPAIATNTGIKAATGDYIKFVDGDDVLHPRSSIELIKGLKETGDGFAFSFYKEVDFDSPDYQNPGESCEDGTSYSIPDPLRYMAKHAHFNLTCVLVKTDLAKKIDGCDERLFIQDYSFCLKMAYVSGFTCVPKTLNFPPLIVTERVSDFGGGAQVLHDLNSALAYFLLDHPELGRDIRGYILRRLTGRAWRWAKRRENKNVFSKEWLNYLIAATNFPLKPTSKIAMESCETFKRTAPLRIPEN